MGKARSLYRGVRVTLTDLPDRDAAIVTVAVKQANGRWDDWSLLFPAKRVSGAAIGSTTDALHVMQAALRMVEAEISR